jgi:hypothetical protein
MNKKFFINYLLLCLLATGCVSNSSSVSPQPTNTRSANNILTPTITNQSTDLHTTTPLTVPDSSSSWESSKKCITVYPSRPDTYHLTGIAVFRSLSSKVLGLKMSLLNLSDGNITEISTLNPVDFASVSPDRKTLAYMHSNTSNSIELVLVDTTGKTQKTLWSSDKDFGFQGWLNNHQIVIVQDSKFIVVDTIKDTQLSFSPSDFPDFDFLLSHFFIGFDPSITKAIYKYSDINILDLSNKTIIARIKDGYDRAPIASWRPSGKQAAVVGTIPIEQNSNGIPDEIFIVEGNGQIRQLTHLYDTFKLVLTIESLHWSPDGNEIAFWLHDGQGNLTLMVVDYATGNTINYCVLNVTTTQFPINVSAPIWSPDGKYLMVENRYAVDKNKILVVDLLNKIAFPIAENANPVGWMVSP